MSEKFPIIGTCPICGNGTDETEDLTEADAPARTTDKTPLPLVWYDGRYVCERCKKTEMRKDVSREMASKHNAADRFRARTGHRTRIT